MRTAVESSAESSVESAHLRAAAWRLTPLGSDGVTASEREALGTLVRVVVWPPPALGCVRDAVETELFRLDEETSRFRPDSELERAHARRDSITIVSSRLAEAISVALWACRVTDGRVDPTVGEAMIRIGYDRDFALLGADEGDKVDVDATGAESRAAAAASSPTPGTDAIRIDGRRLEVPAGVRLDLGATAKALGADRAALAAHRSMRAAGWHGGLIVSFGGDLRCAGEPPVGGWPVAIADDSRDAAGPAGHVVRLLSGALATSSVTVRRWTRRSEPMHHIVDPRTGRPAAGPWRTVSVAARSCVEANVASTAALVAGDEAQEWLAGTGLAARLVSHDGATRRLAGWPRDEGSLVPVRGFVRPPTRRLS